MQVPEIELLWWNGCPSTERALTELRDALADVGLPEAEVRITEVRSDEEARERGFTGSPTILIEGVDCAPTTDEDIGLNCRVYRRRDDRISPTPDPEDVRQALRRALAAERVMR